MDFEKYNDKFLKEYLQFKHKRVVYRRAKLHRIQEDTTTCPECGAKTEQDLEHMETYCTKCGLVTQATIQYIGIEKVTYPYGLHL